MSKIATVIQTYNQAPFIASAIASALEQQVSARHEIVVLDDCSTDGTSDIIGEIARRHSDVMRFVRSPVNQCSNRPLASYIRVTDADYLALLDGDDFWTSPFKLQKQFALLQQDADVAMCFHNVTVVDDGAPDTIRLFNPPHQPARSHIQDLIRANFVAGCSSVIRVNAVRNLPRWYDDTVFGDWPLYLVAATKGDIAYLPDVMATYRVHPNGVWSGLPRIAQIEQLTGFLQEINARFGYAFADVIQQAVVELQTELSAIDAEESGSRSAT